MSDSSTFAFTVMPDHVHWLFQLGRRLSLGQVIGSLKSKSRLALIRAGMRWQRDFFERRLRENERIEDYARYIFLNPYRAKLLALNSTWVGWWCPKPELMEFPRLLNPDGSVPEEWIGEKETDGEGRILVGTD